MWGALLLLIGLTTAPQAVAVPPLPQMLSVFVCETVKGTHVHDMAAQGTEVLGAPNWVDLDWARNADSLKICERTYVSIRDKTQGLPPDAISVHPDASDPTQCAWLALQILGTLKDPAIIVACPRPVYNGQNIVAYTDPPCPPDADCENEPQDL